MRFTVRWSPAGNPPLVEIKRLLFFPSAMDFRAETKNDWAWISFDHPDPHEGLNAATRVAAHVSAGSKGHLDHPFIEIMVGDKLESMNRYAAFECRARQEFQAAVEQALQHIKRAKPSSEAAEARRVLKRALRSYADQLAKFEGLHRERPDP